MSTTHKPTHAKSKLKPKRRASSPRRTPKRTGGLNGASIALTQPATAGTPLKVSAPRKINATGGAKAHAGGSGQIIDRAENVVRYIVAALLMAVVIFTLYETANTLANSVAKSSVPSVAMTVVDGVIFAVILLEIARTVVLRFEKGLQLQRLLIVAMVCAVRDLLAVGAGLALNDMDAASVPHTSLLALGMNAAVVVGLAVALMFIDRYCLLPTEDEQPEDGTEGATL